MASDNEEILGNDEILVVDNFPNTVEFGVPFIVDGNVMGVLKSDSVSLYINNNLIETYQYPTQGNKIITDYSFEYTPTEIGGVIEIAIKTSLNGQTHSVYSQQVMCSEISVARSVAYAYDLLKSILEDEFYVDTSEADGLESLVELVGDL